MVDRERLQFGRLGLLHEQVKKMRDDGQTQHSVAQELDVSRAAISYYENDWQQLKTVKEETLEWLEAQLGGRDKLRRAAERYSKNNETEFQRWKERHNPALKQKPEEIKRERLYIEHALKLLQVDAAIAAEVAQSSGWLGVFAPADRLDAALELATKGDSGTTRQRTSHYKGKRKSKRPGKT